MLEDQGKRSALSHPSRTLLPHPICNFRISCAARYLLTSSLSNLPDLLLKYHKVRPIDDNLRCKVRHNALATPSRWKFLRSCLACCRTSILSLIGNRMDKGRERVNGVRIRFQTDHWSLPPSNIRLSPNYARDMPPSMAPTRPMCAGSCRARRDGETHGGERFVTPARHEYASCRRRSLVRGNPG